ncbi:hypothetical protein JCM3765_001574 [Sporobolomyces pararoseus]
MKSVSIYTLAAVGTVLTGLPRSTLASLNAGSHDLTSAHHRRFHHRQQQQQQQHSGGAVVAEPVENETEDAQVTSLAVREDDSKHQLAKRGGYNGRATFFDPGLGACGTYSGAGDYMVAMNQAQYGDLGAVSPWCFQTITISYGGKTAQAQVLDACPGCPYGGLDMSPGLFKHFADESVGVIYVEWYGGGGGNDQKTTQKTTTTTTTSQWVAPTTTWSPPPTTTWKPTTTYEEPTTTTTTWSPPPTSSSKQVSSSSSSSSSSSTTTTNSTTSTSTNSTLASSSSGSLSGSSSASSSAISASSSASLSSTAIGGNLDSISQLVIAMGNVAGAAVANPNNA